MKQPPVGRRISRAVLKKPPLHGRPGTLGGRPIQGATHILFRFQGVLIEYRMKEMGKRRYLHRVEPRLNVLPPYPDPFVFERKVRTSVHVYG